ncbi:hypothetical protein THAOC_33668, partial [Thalassiosira oceanica]
FRPTENHYEVPGDSMGVWHIGVELETPPMSSDQRFDKIGRSDRLGACALSASIFRFCRSIRPIVDYPSVPKAKKQETNATKLAMANIGRRCAHGVITGFEIRRYSNSDLHAADLQVNSKYVQMDVGTLTEGLSPNIHRSMAIASIIQFACFHLLRIIRFSIACNHVMRSGKHFAVFTGRGRFGVVRPVQIKISDFAEGELHNFSPTMSKFWEYLLGQRTARWTDSNIHCCSLTSGGSALWYDWASDHPITRVNGLQFDNPIGLLLDFDDGTLSIFQNGQRLATLKDGLSGEYCWYATVGGTSILIERGSAPDE